MSQEKPHRSPAKRSSVEFEEEKAWVGFYQHVSNPAIAVEVMNQLESDPEMKRTHLALYLRCKESLRMQKARQARHKRIGQFVRMLSHAVFVMPAIAIKRLLRQSGDIAVECLPEVRKDPAVGQVRRLTQEPEFAQAQSAFDGQAATSSAATAPATKNTTAAKAAKTA